jgi:hypothetical protein
MVVRRSETIVAASFLFPLDSTRIVKILLVGNHMRASAL